MKAECSPIPTPHVCAPGSPNSQETAACWIGLDQIRSDYARLDHVRYGYIKSDQVRLVLDTHPHSLPRFFVHYLFSDMWSRTRTPTFVVAAPVLATAGRIRVSWGDDVLMSHMSRYITTVSCFMIAQPPNTRGRGVSGTPLISATH